MKKLLKILILFVFMLPAFLNAQVNLNTELKHENIDFFYSKTCAHCSEEEKFLDKLENKYPNLNINRYEVSKDNNDKRLSEFAKRTGANQYLGLVPITFIGDSYVVGFNSEETTGLEIENIILYGGSSKDSGVTCDEEGVDQELCEIEGLVTTGSVDSTNTTEYEIIKSASKLEKLGISPENLSLPVLAILLGFLDGFNVCALGALMLILSLVFSFNSRKKIFIFGGLFLLITGVTYSLLIIFWTKIFGLLSGFVHSLELIIGLLGLFGAVYFFNQFYKFRKHGPNCEFSNNKFINNLVYKIRDIFKNSKNVWLIGLMIVVFSFVVTVIEFPCSAVIPVAFSAILTDAGLSTFAYSIYLGLFMLFYLLDEIAIFLFAVWTKKLWSGSVKMTNNLILVQAFIFLGLAVFYLGKLFL